MSDPAALPRLIGERIALARTEAALSQDALASQLGFQDRQTVSAIESGQRAVTAEELVRLGTIFGRSLDFFTDAGLLVEKGEFSYRTAEVPEKLTGFEETARRVLASNHRFQVLLDEPASPVVGQLREIVKQSTPAQAADAGDQLARCWALGDCPAEKLGAMIEAQLHVLVLLVDAPHGLSGAACRLRSGDVILLNRTEPGYRRNWTLAHELFHLLTWEQMPPPRIDPEVAEAVDGKSKPKPKAEILADAFAAGLLMPVARTRTVWSQAHGELLPRILQCAEAFQVSGQAAFYRLKTLGCLTSAEVKQIELPKLARVKPTGGKAPPLYNAEFVRRLHTVLSRGLATVRLAADALDTDVDGLRELFAEHGQDVPFDL
ncbi:MAG: ImmA/IrrE family metallo-endopeptidase [Opitutaceae bacterium]|jgi:Zn-dependent peptidase ImmA (M78 family)/transcriptional regulator with XRE-family HTH domain|nr:ImmA/IrrE family metallo-endopeptidase [Opitutaceae bacterium]MBP8962007.1 ImmA/IrrE family metallo-endopeptidase [Opitutaceae bacterium]